MSRVLPRSLAVPAAAAALLVLPACGAGLEAQTYQERTTADIANSAVGAIAVRAVQVAPGVGDYGLIPAGSDAPGQFTLVNDGGEDDRLVSISTPAAERVELVERETGEVVTSVDVPRLGTTGGLYGFVLRGTTEDLRPGQFVEMTLRLERNGEVTVQVPVATTGEYEAGEREKSENFHPPGEEGGEEGAVGGEGGALSEAGEETDQEQ